MWPLWSWMEPTASCCPVSRIWGPTLEAVRMQHLMAGKAEEASTTCNYLRNSAAWRPLPTEAAA